MQRLQTHTIVVILVACSSNIAILASKSVAQLQKETLKSIDDIYTKIKQLNEEKDVKIETIEKRINELQEELKNETAMRK